jgi:competence protein ComEA
MAGMIRIALVVAAIVLAAFLLWHPAPHPPDAGLASEPSMARAASRSSHGDTPRTPRAASGAAVVYVVGAVRAPGLYRVSPEGRADDAVRQAGGLLPAADPAGVNLAARVSDGEEIDVPLTGARVPSYRTAGTRSGRRRAPLPDASVDINAASADELARVPGIGKAISQRVAELRERDGAFASLDELLDVAGMTPARLERARPFLRAP